MTLSHEDSDPPVPLGEVDHHLGRSGPVPLGRTCYDDGHLAPRRVLLRARGQGRQSASPDLLVELGQLPAHGRSPIRSAGLGEVAQGPGRATG